MRCAVIVLVLLGCDAEPSQQAKPAPTLTLPQCEPMLPAPESLPDVPENRRTAHYWIKRAEHAYGGADAELLSTDAISARNATQPELHDLSLLPEQPQLRAMVVERLDAMRNQLDEGYLVRADSRPVEAATYRAFERPPADWKLSPKFVEATGLVPMYCGPTSAGLYKASNIDRRFDRNLCSTARAGEPMRLLAKWPGNMWLAEARYTWGFVRGDAAFRDSKKPANFTPKASLTRRRILEEAFSHLGEPYGWGGYQGGRDCSRLLHDSFKSLGVMLPRNSGPQSTAGNVTLELEALDAMKKLAAIEEGAHKGIVLLHLPGHIMLYLGKDEEGTAMALHSFAEYSAPCKTNRQGKKAQGNTLYEVHRVDVSTLDLGAGGEKGSLLERIDRLTVFGGT